MLFSKKIQVVGNLFTLKFLVENSFPNNINHYYTERGWLDETKVSGILRHRASSWYWLTFGQGLLSLQQVWVEGECFYFFCFFTVIYFPLSALSLSFISSTISSISLLHFSGRQHKMTHKGQRVIKPQHNQNTFRSNWCTNIVVICYTNVSHDALMWGRQMLYVHRLLLVLTSAVAILYRLFSDFGHYCTDIGHN